MSWPPLLPDDVVDPDEFREAMGLGEIDGAEDLERARAERDDDERPVPLDEEDYDADRD